MNKKQKTILIICSVVFILGLTGYFMWKKIYQEESKVENLNYREN